MKQSSSDLDSEVEHRSNQTSQEPSRFPTAGNEPSQGPSRFTTAGNEGDVEDNDNVMPYIPPTTTEELCGKLRHKPPECCPTAPCRILSAHEDFMKNSSLRQPWSTGERLTHRPKSAIENLTDTIPKPENAVPPLALPDWHCLPLDRKIPCIPAPRGLLYYTPGKLSYKLHRKPKVYSTRDPYNRERVVGSPYTALHDPHAKDFIKRPQTKRILYEQGLINEKDEVMYSLKEFNKFRDYLRTLHRDDVLNNLNDADSLWKAEQEQVKMLRKYIDATEGKEALRQTRLRRARWLQKEARDLAKARYLRKQAEAEARLNAYWKEKELIQAERVVRGLERSRLQREKLQSIEIAKQKQVISAWHKMITKEVQVYERRISEQRIVKQAQENFLLEWMDAKINFSRERMDRSAGINLAWHESLKTKAKRRQKRVETFRENLPKIIEKRKAFEAWRWGCARKYFYIWLEKTRERSSAHKSAYESVFSKGTLEQTLNYLKLQAGTEDGLDAFILNIMRLKEEIKRQLALEEENDQNLADQEDMINKEVKRRVTEIYGSGGAEQLAAAAEAASAAQSKKSILKKQSSSDPLSEIKSSLIRRSEDTMSLMNKRSISVAPSKKKLSIQDSES